MQTSTNSSPITGLIAVVLALVLLYAGISKIWINPVVSLERFVALGLPDFMPYLTGTLEIAAGLLLLLPLLRTFGALLAAGLMVAATTTHWANGQGFSEWWLSLFLGMIAVGIIWARPVALPSGEVPPN